VRDDDIHPLGTGFQTACSPTIISHVCRSLVKLAGGQRGNSMKNSFISLVV